MSNVTYLDSFKKSLEEKRIAKERAEKLRLYFLSKSLANELLEDINQDKIFRSEIFKEALKALTKT